MFTVQGIDHIGLAVKDVRKSVEWYREMFGLERLYEDVWGDFPGVVGIGKTSVAFFPMDDSDANLPTGLPIHNLSFRVNRLNFNAARETLQQKEISFEIQDHRLFTQFTFMIRMVTSLNSRPTNYRINAIDKWLGMTAVTRSGIFC